MFLTMLVLFNLNLPYIFFTVKIVSLYAHSSKCGTVFWVVRKKGTVRVKIISEWSNGVERIRGIF